MSEKDVLSLIDEMIDSGVNLPSPPAIAVRILNAVQQEKQSYTELAKIISSDPALTAKMLKVANSGFYSPNYKVTNIEKALSVLGVNVLKNIALSFVISKKMRGSSDQTFDFDYFWRRSVTSAVAAELFALQIGHQNDDIFVTAMLADIGILILHQALSKEYQMVIIEGKTSNEPVSLIEKRLLGIDHCSMGAGLLDCWHLPASICLPIRYHHSPDQAPDQYRQAAEVLQIADHLSSIYHDSNSGERVRTLQTELMERFDLTKEKIIEIVDAVASRSVEILTTFEIDPGDLKPYSEILEEANKELGQLNLSYDQLILELMESKTEADRLAAELHGANLKLRELVFRDGLTGLYNHRYFQDMVDKEIDRFDRYNSCFALIMFDIDFFKKVNDNHGHPSGDQVLLNIAQTIQKAVRPSDIVARYGGEEFAVIMPEANVSGLKIFAERLRRSVEQMSTLVDNKELKVTISVGGTCCLPDSGKLDKKTIIDTADRALYASKHGGRNCTTILPLGN